MSSQSAPTITLQYKASSKQIQLPECFSKLMSSVKFGFPTLSKFQIEYESKGVKQLIDSDEMYEKVKAKFDKTTEGIFTIKPKETNEKENSEYVTLMTDEKIQETTTGGETNRPITFKERVYEQFTIARARFETTVDYVGKKIEDRVDNMKPENKERLAKVRNFSNGVISAGAKITQAAMDEFTKIVNNPN